MILLALGANLPSRIGTPLQTLNHVLALLPRHGVRVVAVSGFYSNPAVPASDQPDFINCIARVETVLTPEQLLQTCLEIERDLGRVRTEKWAARTIDLDIVDYDGRRMSGDDLTLPHPRIAERAFVLVPIRDVAPDWWHPVTGERIEALIEALPPDERAILKPLALQ